MSVPANKLFIYSYTEETGGRIGLNLYYSSTDGSTYSGYTIEVTKWVPGTGQHTTESVPMTLGYPNMIYRVIEPTFYDAFDITNIWYYNSEVSLYHPHGSAVTVAISLKKDGILVDTLGDPSGTSPLLAWAGITGGRGAIVRNDNFTSTDGSYLATDWNAYKGSEVPGGFWSFFETYTLPDGPDLAPPVSISIDGFSGPTFDENDLNDGDAGLLGQGISLTAENVADFGGGTLTVGYSGAHGADDNLSVIGNSSNPLGISVSGNTVSYGNVVIGTIDAVSNGTAGADLVVHLNGNANPAAVGELLNSLGYRTTSDAPASTRTVKISLTDGKGHSAADVTATVTVNPQNDAPTIGGSHEGEGLVGGGIAVTTSMLDGIDPDNLPSELTFTVTGTSNGSIEVDGHPASSFTLADVIANKVVFRHDGTQTTSGSFTVSLKDVANAGTGTTTVDLTISRLNHAPVGNDRTLPLNEDDHHTFSLGDFAFMDPDDSDLPNQLKAIVIVDLPATGTLTFNNVAVTIGQEIPAAELGSLVYTPPAGTSGTGLGSFRFRVKDDGGTAQGGVDTSLLAYEISFDVAPVNDAPTSQDGSVTVLEDGSRAFTLGDFAFADIGDASAPNGLMEIVIGDLPLDGTLEFNGIPVIPGQAIPVGEIGNLVFRPAADGNGDGYATFTFAVRDDGGTLNGGINTSVEYTMTIDVTPVNDAPAGNGQTVTVQEDGSHEFTEADFGFSDVKDGADRLLSIELTAVPSVGTLTFQGNPVAAGDIIPASLISSLIFEPAANVSGAGYAEIRFRLRDDGGTANGGVDLSAEASVRIDVTPVNDAPVVTGLSPTVAIPDTATVRPFSTVAISDIDSTSLTVTVSMDRADLGVISRATGFRANPDGTYTMTGAAAAIQGALRSLTFDPVDNKLAPGLVGTTKFTVTVNDGTDVTTTHVDVEITSINDSPITVNDGPITVDEGSGYSATALKGVLANDTDADKDVLAVSGVKFGGVDGSVGNALTGTYGTLVLNADGSYSFVADQDAATALVAGQSGTDVFTYTVSDGNGGTATGTLTFRVNGTTLLIEGLELAKRTVTNSDGSLTQTIDVPLVADGGADGVIDVPVAKSATGQTLLTATIPVGAGMRISGSPSAKGVAGGTGDLLKAIEDRTQPGSADQQALTGGAQGFLSGLPANSTVLVQTVDITSAPTNGQPISISGAAAAGSPKTAVLVDASSLPSGTVLKIDNVDFVMVIGAVRVTGGSGPQTAWGDGSGQWMVLGEDDDVLHGGGGDDYVGSLGGNDALYGDEGNDTLSGGEGNDTLDGGTGLDLMMGGTGNDTYYVDMADDVVRETRGQGTDTVISSVNYVLGSHVENLTLRGEAKVGYGNSLANVMRATDKGSLLYGWAGNDTVYGGAGVDRLYGSSGDDRLYGRDGNDRLYGGSGKDRLDGGNGNDYLSGESGNDVLKGGAGNDTINGGTGDDVIHGGKGADLLYGSSGRDSFVFDTKPGKGNVDTIKAFSVAYDTIRLDDAVFAKAGPKGWLKAEAFRFGSEAREADVRIIYDAAKGALYYDADGSGSGKAVQFAKIGKNLMLTHEDFLIV